MISWWWLAIVGVVVWCAARYVPEMTMEPSPLDRHEGPRFDLRGSASVTGMIGAGGRDYSAGFKL